MTHRAQRWSTRAVVGAGLVAVTFFCTSRSVAQGPEATIPFEGTQAFRRYILHDLFGLTPLRDFQQLSEDPKSALLIVFGDTSALRHRRGSVWSIPAFKDRGGAVLIASDRKNEVPRLHLGPGVDRRGGPDVDGRLGPGVDGHWGAGVDGLLVHQRADGAYRHIPECPLVIDFRDPRHPLFQDITQGIATNQPSSITPGATLPVLAVFPPGCRRRNPFGGTRQDPAEPPVFMVGSAGNAPPGERVVIMAGHSVFMNGMMSQRDNDNFKFACNCVRWLTDGGKRRRVLFIEEGSVQDQFDVPLKALPLPPLPPGHVVDKILRGLEDEGFFDRLLVALVPRNRILAGLLLLLSVGVLVYGARRLVRARHRIETAVPLVAAGQLASVDGDLPVMTQRYRDVVCGGNLWEAARALARSCFDPAQEGLPGHPAPAPPVAVAGSWRQRWTLARQVRRMWELAYGAEPVPVSPAQFARLGAIVQTVRSALADGTLRFQGQPASH